MLNQNKALWPTLLLLTIGLGALALLLPWGASAALGGQPLHHPATLFGHLYVMDITSLERVSSGGATETIVESGANAFGSKLEIHNDELYVKLNNSTIRVYSLNGQSYRNIPLSTALNGNLVVLPDGRMALLDNVDDEVHFVDSEGQWLAKTPLREEEDNSLQSIDGVVVDNRLIVLHDGDKNLVAIDLDSYEASLFRDFSALLRAPTAIAYGGGYYYMSTYNTVYRFTEDEWLSSVGQLPSGDSNIVGLAIAGNYVYATVNHAGKLYAFDLDGREAPTLIAEFEYPQDLEFHPQNLYLRAIQR